MASFRYHSMFIQTIYVLIIETLFISVLLASPTPQFFFPTNDVNFQNDEYQDVKKCLDDDYSMPYFNPSTQEVVIQLYNNYNLREYVAHFYV